MGFLPPLRSPAGSQSLTPQQGIGLRTLWPLCSGGPKLDELGSFCLCPKASDMAKTRCKGQRNRLPLLTGEAAVTLWRGQVEFWLHVDIHHSQSVSGNRARLWTLILEPVSLILILTVPLKNGSLQSFQEHHPFLEDLACSLFYKPLLSSISRALVFSAPLFWTFLPSHCNEAFITI